MGQYFRLANLDKQEFLNPYEMGHGAKACEQAWGPYGLGQALLLLLGTGMGRGGGDFNPAAPSTTQMPPYTPGAGFYPAVEAHFKAENERAAQAREVLGRWAGDRIVFVGDYAEDEDNKAIPFYGSLYARMEGYIDAEWKAENAEVWGNGEGGVPPSVVAEWEAESWTEISDLVRPYMTANFGCEYEDTSYGKRLRERGESASVKLAPDMMFGG